MTPTGTDFTNYLLTGVFFVLIVCATTGKLSHEDDYFWHFASGRYITENKVVPSGDIFSYTTAGEQWIPFEWGWDVISYSLVQNLGYAGLSIFNSFVFLIMYYLFFRLLKKLSVNYALIFFFFVLMTVAILPRMVPRPHIISYLFYTVILTLILGYRKNEKFRGIYFVPIIFAFWANMHMGVLVGAIIFAIFFLSQAIGKKPGTIKLLVILTASLTALLLNPHGWHTYEYVISHLQMSKMVQVDEWMSPFSQKYSGQVYTIAYFIYFAVSTSILYYAFIKKDFFTFLLYIIFAINSVRALRYAADFVLITTVLAATAVNYQLASMKKLSKYMERNSIPRIALTAVIVALTIGVTNNDIHLKYMNYTRYFGFGIDTNFFPVKMFQFMKENRITETGNIPFNTYECGGYFVWSFPAQRNFIDSRAVNDKILREFEIIYSMKPGFQKKIEDYGFDYAVISERDLVAAPQYMKELVIHYFFSSNEWRLVYWDDHSLLFLRDLPKFQHVILKYSYMYLTPYNILYGKAVIERGLAENNTRLQAETERKRREDAGSMYFNHFLRIYGDRIR